MSSEREHLEREHAGREHTGHEHSELDCAAVLADLSQLLDNECSDDIRASLRDHIDHCGPCLEAYGIEEQVKSLIGRKCGGERAPEGLRARLQINIRSATMLIRGGDAESR